jgi:hypothetical protein
MVIAAIPPMARELSIRIDRFVDLFPVVGRAAVGPWSFSVALLAGAG